MRPERLVAFRSIARGVGGDRDGTAEWAGIVTGAEAEKRPLFKTIDAEGGPCEGFGSGGGV